MDTIIHSLMGIIINLIFVNFRNYFIDLKE